MPAAWDSMRLVRSASASRASRARSSVASRTTPMISPACVSWARPSNQRQAPPLVRMREAWSL